jgi:preprotein translocase subunit SecE
LSVIDKTKLFLEDVRAEMGKVTWPTRKETIATSWVVITIVLLISLYLGACDMILAKLIRIILR